jgi:DSF synthase
MQSMSFADAPARGHHRPAHPPRLVPLPPSLPGLAAAPAGTEIRGDRPRWLAASDGFRQLAVTFDPARKAVWQTMSPNSRPSFTKGLLDEMLATLGMIEGAFSGQGEDDGPIRYLVLNSAMPGIFNLGGDLALFHDLIERRERDHLQAYAHACAHIQHRFSVALNLPLMTIALVQGDALGGGFEAALAQEVIIAERSATFGLPEILFNMFAGMGAYSFLCRRLHPTQAERLILSGQRYGAEELTELGVVDRVVDDGDGKEAVAAFIDETDRQWNARRAMQRVRRHLQPVSLQDLLAVVDIWVDAALRLSPSDLRRMKHLARAQDKRWSRRAA